MKCAAETSGAYVRPNCCEAKPSANAQMGGMVSNTRHTDGYDTLLSCEPSLVAIHTPRLHTSGMVITTSL